MRVTCTDGYGLFTSLWLPDICVCKKFGRKFWVLDTIKKSLQKKMWTK